MGSEVIEFDNQILKQISQLIHEKTGIYWSSEKKYLLTHKISRLLNNNSYNNLNDCICLFVGHSESLLNMTDKIEPVFCSVYKKNNV